MEGEDRLDEYVVILTLHDLDEGVECLQKQPIGHVDGQKPRARSCKALAVCLVSVEGQTVFFL